jgi:hypothetical protein
MIIVMDRGRMDGDGGAAHLRQADGGDVVRGTYMIEGKARAKGDRREVAFLRERPPPANHLLSR